MVKGWMKGLAAGALVLVLVILLVPAIQQGSIPGMVGDEDTDTPVLTAVVGTNRFPTITTFITNALTGANVGDDTNDHAYIIELDEPYAMSKAQGSVMAASSFAEIKAAYLADPGSVCEPRAGWDDTTPPAAGVASRQTYEVGKTVLVYIDAQTEHDIVYHYVVQEPDFQAVTVQADFPVFTPAAAWAEIYLTEIGTVIATATVYDLSNEGADTEDQISWTIRTTTADSCLGWFLTDPVYDATRYDNLIPYFYATGNVSTNMCIDAEDSWADGTLNIESFFYSLDHHIVAPEDWGCPQHLQVISGEPIGVNIDADANDGFISGLMTWSVISAVSNFTCGLEASDTYREFGMGTPAGDVTEVLQIQA